MQPKRGEVYWITLRGTGNVQVGHRPAVIVQQDGGNRTSPTTVILPLTSKQRRPYPFVVEIPAGDGNLNGTGYAHCEQIRTVNCSELEDYIGTLSPETMERIGKALRYELDL